MAVVVAAVRCVSIVGAAKLPGLIFRTKSYANVQRRRRIRRPLVPIFVVLKISTYAPGPSDPVDLPISLPTPPRWGRVSLAYDRRRHIVCERRVRGRRSPRRRREFAAIDFNFFGVQRGKNPHTHVVVEQQYLFFLGGATMQSFWGITTAVLCARYTTIILYIMREQPWKPPYFFSPVQVRLDIIRIVLGPAGYLFHPTPNNCRT